MANLTLTIDENTLRNARIRALHDGTSINALVRQYLESYSRVHSHGEVVSEIVDMSKKFRSRKGSAKWTRDDLHDRKL
jgi:hypothetical protein